MSFHEHLYSDPKRVHAARVQAEGRIGARRLKATLLESVLPMVQWLSDRLDRLARKR